MGHKLHVSQVTCTEEGKWVTEGIMESKVLWANGISLAAFFLLWALMAWVEQ